MGGLSRVQDPFAGMFNNERIKELKEKTLEPYKKEVTRIEDQIKLDKNKEESWLEMQGKIATLQNAAKALRYNQVHTTDAFSQKTSEISTTDNGDGDDYLAVTTTSKAPLGSINVSVTSLATAASVVLGLNNNDGRGLLGFRHDENIHTKLHRITIDHHHINIDDRDTIFDVQRKINSSAQLNNLNATVIKGENDLHYLSLQYKTTGLHVIGVTAVDHTDHAIAHHLVEKHRLDGVNAVIYINGIHRTSQSNTISDAIPGVTIDLKRVNSSLDPDDDDAYHHSQTITIKNDPEAVTEGVVDFMNAYNDYLEFSARMQQRARKGYAETAYLGGASGIKHADDSLSYVTFMNNSIVEPDLLKSLASIGIELVDVPASKDSPPHKQLTIKDRDIFRDAMHNKREAIENLFKDKITAVAPVAGNHNGSSLSIIQNNKAILNGPLYIKVTNNGLAGYAAQYSSDRNVWRNANYNQADDKVTFVGTQFEGIELAFTPNRLAHGQDDTFNFSQGLADRLALTTEQISESLMLEIENVHEEEDQYEQKKERAEKILAEQQKRVEREFSKIEMIALETSLMMELFDGLND